MFKFDRKWVQQWGARVIRASTLSGAGITPRLAMAFVVVSILAATSNFIVENGASIIERAINPVVLADLDSRAPRLGSTAQEQVLSRITSAQLALAWGSFDKAVRDHAESRTKESEALYVASRIELERLATDYAPRSGNVTGDVSREMPLALRDHEKTAEALIEAARSRQGQLASYSTIFARISMRLQASIDGAWKILGRVVARQSLLKLNAQLDGIQNSFATRGGSAATGGQASLAFSEQAFAATLKNNEAALRRSQGSDWYDGLSKDFAQLTSLRMGLSRAEARKASLAQSFASESAKFVDSLSQPFAPITGNRAGVTPAAEPATPARTFTPVVAAAPPIVESPTPRRTIVAWVSGIVLAVLAYISVGTILSVVRPVRRLVEATGRVARGEAVPPMGMGGIAELDTLSRSFNQMAGQLAEAQAANREVLQSLEVKVEERTRQLQDLAERDPLTGLANRRQLFAALNESIAEAAATRKRVGAFFLDIDNFKTLNDSMGHAYGDRVLTAIATRLERVAHAFGFAARLGGDEFMVVHERAATMDEIVASGTAIVEAFQKPIKVDGRQLIVSVSVGASVFPDHEKDAEALLRAADAALFNAKAAGRSQLKVFTPDLLLRASAKFAIEQNLRRAIEKGEFELFYQPEINVQTLEVSLVEALIRWRMPDGSYRTPEEFLAVAEESGLIMEISDWVLRSAIETASDWHYGAWPGVRMAVNVSPRQFLDFRFVEKLQDLLDEFGLPAQSLELELTESVLQTGPATIEALKQLRALGVAIALDDFGTGYSSMASLEQLPLTRIKLDRSLIARMDSNARSASIARATIGLCAELGLQVTAEGVERLEQFSALLEFQSMCLQGYLLARPVSRAALLPLLGRMPARCQELVLMARSAAPAMPASQRGDEPPLAKVELTKASAT